MTDTPLVLSIGIIGGTGKEGKGLAYRWARAGYRIFIGSRSPEKAQAAAAEVMGMLDGHGIVEGTGNDSAARQSDILVLTVPYAAHTETLQGLRESAQGKLLVDVTVPLVPPKLNKVQMPAAGSAAQEARQILGEGVQVATAFQNVSYEHLLGDHEVDCDVLVTGSSPEARSETLRLVEAAGLIGWDAGPIENSVVVEGMTSVLIAINKKYGSTHAGIRITGARRT
jgi:NADPH-dependent F420 reductase